MKTYLVKLRCVEELEANNVDDARTEFWNRVLDPEFNKDIEAFLKRYTTVEEIIT